MTENELEKSSSWDCRCEQTGFFQDGFPFEEGYPERVDRSSAYALITRNGERRIAHFYPGELMEGQSRWVPLDGGMQVGPQVVVAWREIAEQELIDCSLAQVMGAKYREATRLVLENQLGSPADACKLIGMPSVSELVEVLLGDKDGIMSCNGEYPHFHDPARELLMRFASRRIRPVRIILALGIALIANGESPGVEDLSGSPDDVEGILKRIELLCPYCHGKQGEIQCQDCHGKGILV